MKKKVCITYYTFPHVGGISSIIDDLWDYLSTKYEVHIFVYKAEGDITKYKDKIHICSRRIKIGVYIFPSIWFYLIFMSYKLWRFHRRNKFDLILSQDGFCSGLFSLVAGKLTKTRVVIMDHGVITNILDLSWEKMMWEVSSAGWKTTVRRTMFPFSRFSFRAIIKLVTMWGEEFLFSGKELETYYAQERVPSFKLKKYSHLINTEWFKPLSSEEKNRQRKDKGVSTDVTLINMVTRLDEEKGFEYALPGLEKARGFESNFLVLIAGDGRRRKSIQEYLKAHQMEDYVRLLGALDREGVKELMQISDLHLYAGIIGCNVSIALLEAMACGCAAIVTNVPEMHSNIVSPEIGWVIPPKDENALTHSLSEALRNRMRLQGMGMNARKYIELNHSYEVAGKFFDFFGD